MLSKKCPYLVLENITRLQPVLYSQTSKYQSGPYISLSGTPDCQNAVMSIEGPS